MNKGKYGYILPCILLLAAGLRLWGLAHGWPYSYYPDEAHLVKRALAFGSGDLNPHWFHKPAFIMYLLFVHYGMFFVFGKLLGWWLVVQDFAVYYIDNPGPFYLIGRSLVVVFSLGNVWLTYCLASRLMGRSAGWLAALIMALAVGAVMAAKDVKEDTACAFFTLFSCYWLMRYLQQSADRRSKHWLALASVMAGIGAATKVYSVVMLVPIAAGILWLDRGTLLQRCGRFLGQLSLFCATYFVCSPYNILDPLGLQNTFGLLVEAYKKLGHLLGFVQMKVPEGVSKEISNIDHSPLDFLYGLGQYVVKLATGMNPVVLLLMMTGVTIAILRRERLVAVFLLFPVVFAGISIFLNPGYADIRHQLALYPFVAVMAAYGVTALQERVLLRRIAIAALAVMMLFDLGRAVQFNQLLAREDVRNVARHWIEDNIPVGEKILLDEEGPVLRKSEAQLRQEITVAQQAAPGPFTFHYGRYLEYQLLANRGKVSYEIFDIRLPWWRSGQSGEGVHHLTSDSDADMGNPLRPVGVLTYDEYLRQGYRYAIVQSRKYEPFLRGTYRADFPAFQAFYRDLFARGREVQSFSGTGGAGHPEPVVSITIRVFELH